MMRLLKGLEEEVYAGTPEGIVAPLSHLAAADLQGFEKEPDARNVEFTTQPLLCYEQLGCEIVARRKQLRRYLLERGGFTLIPGSCLPQDDGHFQRSDPANPYHSYIEEQYGTTVVTAGTHINLGINDPEENVRVWRTIRMESALYLALSAASPFHNGRRTGYHSYRWQRFPLTPKDVPLFGSHGEFVSWVQARLQDGQMYNVRHLWTSIRPNGTGTPDQLERLELRICDRIDCVLELLAVTAFFENRAWSVLEDHAIDPLRQATWLGESSRGAELVALEAVNNEAAAQNSLDARYRRWQDGKDVWLRDEIEGQLSQLAGTARKHRLSDVLVPIQEILLNGNPAQRWLAQLAKGVSIPTILQNEIPEMEAREAAFACGCIESSLEMPPIVREIL